MKTLNPDSPYGVELKNEYNRRIRARRIRRTFALIGAAALTMICLLGYGMLVASTANGLASLIALVVLLWGIWGADYLSKHH